MLRNFVLRAIGPFALIRGKGFVFFHEKLFNKMVALVFAIRPACLEVLVSTDVVVEGTAKGKVIAQQALKSVPISCVISFEIFSNEVLCIHI